MPIQERNLSPSLAAKIAQMGIFLSPNANIIYVDSGNTNAGTGKPGSNPRNPLSTINAAFTAADTAVTASNGDLIVVMPGHAEDIANATDLAPDVVGVTILGLGRGSDRPTLTLTATGSNIPISAANITMANLLITISGTINVVVGITVSAADVLLRDIEMRQPNSDDEFVDAVILTTGADRCRVEGFIFDGITQGGAGQSAILINAALPRIQIADAWIVGDFATGAIENSTAMTDCLLQRLVIQQIHATAACVNAHADMTGFLIGARFRMGTDDASGMTEAITSTTKLQVYDLLIVNADGEEAAAPSMETTLDTANQMWGTISAI